MTRRPWELWAIIALLAAVWVFGLFGWRWGWR